MRMIRYLFFMTFLLSCILSWGQDDFNPDNPSEPGYTPTKLIVLAEPSDGGYVDGGGKFMPASSVGVRAYNYANFVFVNWTDTKGNIVSTSSSYYMQKGYGKDSLIAHFAYSPNSPAEPVPAGQLLYHRLNLMTDGGGYMYGAGRYRCGSSVELTANCEAHFDFVGWTNEEGDVVSTNSRFYYTTNGFSETLRANFRYNPDSPVEPSLPVLHHKIILSCTDGGTAYAYQNSVLEGNATRITANVNSGYVFLGWFLNGAFYTGLRDFSYTMGSTDANFEARFEFNPDSPTEPDRPADKKYALYLMTDITYPNSKVDCPLYLTSLDSLFDMTFQLTFPQEALPDWNTLTVDAKAKGYTVSVAETETPHVYVLTFHGGKVAPGNTKLVNVKLTVPETVATDSSFQVKINQVSMTEKAGNTVTASTRNGKVTVYKLGDSNGDGQVNVTDKMNLVLDVLGQSPEDFINEVSDVNGDGIIDVSDGMGVIGIILDK